MQSHDAVIRVYDDAGNIVEIDCPSFPVPVPVLSDAHVEWRVLYVCAARFDYFDLTSKTKRRGGHDRNCSNNSWPNERQIEVLAAGLQKGGGSLNKPHRKWSLTNSKLRSPKNSIRHLTKSRRASPRGGFLFFLKSKAVIHPTTLRTRPRARMSHSRPKLYQIGCEAEGCRNN